MASHTLIESLLRKVAELLREHNDTNWGDAIQQLLEEYGESPEVTKVKIRSLYGGMGSFNDVVLCGTDGLPLRTENDELDRLRSQLFAACRE